MGGELSVYNIFSAPTIVAATADVIHTTNPFRLFFDFRLLAYPFIFSKLFY